MDSQLKTTPHIRADQGAVAHGRALADARSLLEKADTPEAQCKAFELMARTYVEMTRIAQSFAAKAKADLDVERQRVAGMKARLPDMALNEQSRLRRKIALAQDGIDDSMQQVAMAAGQANGYAARVRACIQQIERIQDGRAMDLGVGALDGLTRVQ